jgi:hypothetical protein
MFEYEHLLRNTWDLWTMRAIVMFPEWEPASRLRFLSFLQMLQKTSIDVFIMVWESSTCTYFYTYSPDLLEALWSFDASSLPFMVNVMIWRRISFWTVLVKLRYWYVGINSNFARSCELCLCSNINTDTHRRNAWPELKLKVTSILIALTKIVRTWLF